MNSIQVNLIPKSLEEPQLQLQQISNLDTFHTDYVGMSLWSSGSSGSHSSTIARPKSYVRLIRNTKKSCLCISRSAIYTGNSLITRRHSSSSRRCYSSLGMKGTKAWSLQLTNALVLTISILVSYKRPSTIMRDRCRVRLRRMTRLSRRSPSTSCGPEESTGIIIRDRSVLKRQRNKKVNCKGCPHLAH